MKRYWLLKLLSVIVGLGLILFGWAGTQTDPELRQLKPFGIEQIEQGVLPPMDQYVEITDAYLMPVWVTHSRESRKRGKRTYVYLPLGSEASQEKVWEEVGAEGKERVAARLWVRLDRSFKTQEEADAAMQASDMFEEPFVVRGVVERLERDVVEEAQSIEDLSMSETVLSIDENSAPLSLGASMGMALAGGLLLVFVALWVVADLKTAQWLRTLEGGGAVFSAKSPVLIGAVLGVPFGLVCAGLAMQMWSDEGQVTTVPIVLAALAALGLAIGLWGVWCNRAAVILGADAVETVRGQRRTSIPLAEVDALGVNEKKVRGVRVHTYKLHRGDQVTKLGSGWFSGGIDDPQPLGMALRDALLQRLLPVLRNKVNAGQFVSFGPFLLSAQGLVKGKSADSGEVLPWSQVESATLKNGELKIKEKGKMFAWGSFSVPKLLNVDVLMNLLEEKLAA